MRQPDRTQRASGEPSQPDPRQGGNGALTVKNTGSLLRALVVLSIVLSTVVAGLLYQRTESYAWDSSVYIGLARSLLERGAYEFNFEPHTFYPPGLPLLLAAITTFSSLDFVVLVRWMTVTGAGWPSSSRMRSCATTGEPSPLPRVFSSPPLRSTSAW